MLLPVLVIAEGVSELLEVNNSLPEIGRCTMT